MVKLILEKDDIVELIKAKYPTAEIEKGLVDDIQIYVKVTEIKTASLKESVQTVAPIEIPVVRDRDGNIDAEKSGLTLQNRKQTIPGGQMGRTRGNLRKF